MFITVTVNNLVVKLLVLHISLMNSVVLKWILIPLGGTIISCFNSDNTFLTSSQSHFICINLALVKAFVSDIVVAAFIYITIILRNVIPNTKYPNSILIEPFKIICQITFNNS